jgi:hypothetical protein
LEAGRANEKEGEGGEGNFVMSIIVLDDDVGFVAARRGLIVAFGSLVSDSC